jgi:hypothetical protein
MKRHSCLIGCWILLGGLLLGSFVTASWAGETVPPPAQTPVDLLISGRTSTLKSITIRKVGQMIPETFSGMRVKNTEGFTWYVSRHYALKTNPTEEKDKECALMAIRIPRLFSRKQDAHSDRGSDRTRNCVS